MQTLLLQPAFPENQRVPQAPADDQEEEMVEIKHRAYKEQNTVALADEQQQSGQKTVTDKSLLRKFFGN